MKRVPLSRWDLTLSPNPCKELFSSSGEIKGLPTNGLIDKCITRIQKTIHVTDRTRISQKFRTFVKATPNYLLRKNTRIVPGPLAGSKILAICYLIDRTGSVRQFSRAGPIPKNGVDIK